MLIMIVAWENWVRVDISKESKYLNNQCLIRLTYYRSMMESHYTEWGECKLDQPGLHCMNESNMESWLWKGKGKRKGFVRLKAVSCSLISLL